MTIRSKGRALAGLALVLALAACGGSGSAPGDLVSADAYAAPAAINADSKLLVHWMTGVSGLPTRATALLFVPKGSAPSGGWPVVVWVHGTTTVGSGAPAATVCSASESPTLDGGLTADGFNSHYIDTIATLVSAGYAVVAPDLEGLGAQAQRDGTPHAYFNLASSGNAVATAVVAAHQAVTGLSNNWASVGHSEGGHAVLALEGTAGAASAYSYKGTVAIAPFNAIEASVGVLDTLAGLDAANLVLYRTEQQQFVGMMSMAVATQRADFQPAAVMGADLLALMPAYKGQCIFKLFGALGADIAAKTPAAFKGYSASWASNAMIKSFLQTNDEAVNPSFKVTKPTLVLQGGLDPFVFESLQTPFMGRLKAAGMPVTYKTFVAADHSSIMTQGRADMLAFLKTILP